MQPIAFQFGPITVHWFGVCIALAFLAGMWTAARRASRIGVPGEVIADLVVPWLLIGGIVGARLMFVVTYWQDEFVGKPWWEIFMIQRGGLVFYGGLIGSSLAAIIFAGLKGVSVWKLADILAPSIALGSMFGRFGCLMNGCCYGRACEMSWAIRFPASHSTGGVPVHPTQLYDALLNLGLYLGLAAWFRFRRKFDGQIFAIYLMCYAVTRSTVEFFRGDYSDGHLHGGFTPAHLLSVAILVAGIVLYRVLAPRPKPVT